MKDMPFQPNFEVRTIWKRCTVGSGQIQKQIPKDLFLNLTFFCF